MFNRYLLTPSLEDRTIPRAWTPVLHFVLSAANYLKASAGAMRSLSVRLLK